MSILKLIPSRLFPLATLLLLLPTVLVACGDKRGASPGITQEANGVSPLEPTLALQRQSDPSVFMGSGEASPSLSFPSVAEVAEMVRPGVVTLTTQTRSSDFLSRPTRGIQSGTGLFITPEGHLVTNYHVIQNAERILVTTDSGQTMEAEVTGTDPGTDLAVLKVTHGDSFEALRFADADSVRVGDWVIAIGNALGFQGGPTVTIGVVGALNRSLRNGDQFFTDLVQTDAAINEGNSGGPLVNLKGEVVGINTIVVRTAQGIGFSIGTFTVVPVVESILKHGRVIWPWLGISAEDVTPSIALEEGLTARQGVLVRRVWPESPADEAGMKAGDVILTLDEAATPDLRQLQRLMRGHFQVDQEITVKLLRGEKEREMRLTLEEMPR